MASGKPVLASDVKPMVRLVEKTQCGLIYQGDDADDCCAKLLTLQSRELRRELGLKGMKAVAESYNWDTDGKRLMQALHKVFSCRQNVVSSNG